jgi:predicted dehydrogenase
MNHENGVSHAAKDSRREFLRKTSAAVVGAGVTARAAGAARTHVAGGETLRVGLIGCGARGTGAADQAMRADRDVKLVAMADMFGERLEKSRARLRALGGDKFDVADERCFVGFDAYRRLIDSGVDVVLLAAPPHFRPRHLKAAVDAGKHVFMEKPVAVDAPGVHAALRSCQEAKAKGLSIVSGLMLRYSSALRETVRRIHDGQIGKIVALQSNYNIGGSWVIPRQPGWSDMEWQLRNWYYFTWLSGDHIVEQHVHGLDLMAWVMQDEHPKQCIGLGGRQARTEAQFGHIFDHHAVCYEFAGGTRCFSYCRQQPGTYPDTSQLVFGSEGAADLRKAVTTTDQETWRYSRARGAKEDAPYQQEQNALFASIRSGEPLNNGDYAAKSTLMAIMGRMATYTGQQITWEQAWNSQEDLTPERYEFGPLPTPPVAIPGLTPLL